MPNSRDPVDRAYSNWVHLRADGLEPEPDFLRACSLEPGRVARGFAPFWRHLELGRYGEKLAHLFQHVDQERVHVIRYRELIDDPVRTLDGIAAFLGGAGCRHVDPGVQHPFLGRGLAREQRAQKGGPRRCRRGESGATAGMASGPLLPRLALRRRPRRLQ